jgi:DNA-binding NarL/FixJ family response regulator
MPRGAGSQGREIMAQKRELARRLLAQGLTLKQIATQLNCSENLVRTVRREMEGEAAPDDGEPPA